MKIESTENCNLKALDDKWYAVEPVDPTKPMKVNGEKVVGWNISDFTRPTEFAKQN